MDVFHRALLVTNCHATLWVPNTLTVNAFKACGVSVTILSVGRPLRMLRVSESAASVAEPMLMSGARIQGLLGRANRRARRASRVRPWGALSWLVCAMWADPHAGTDDRDGENAQPGSTQG